VWKAGKLGGMRNWYYICSWFDMVIDNSFFLKVNAIYWSSGLLLMTMKSCSSKPAFRISDDLTCYKN
jgi:hypothetical protein